MIKEVKERTPSKTANVFKTVCRITLVELLLKVLNLYKMGYSYFRYIQTFGSADIPSFKGLVSSLSSFS